MPTDMGWVKAHRKLLNNPVVCKDSDHMAVWFFLLLSAAHSEQTVVFGGAKITLLPGQLLTSRNVVANTLKIDPSKVYRILKRYEIEQQIEQRTDRQQSLITIKNWGFYQNDFEQRNEQQVNNECTTRQENKDEEEKRSKKEKEENKELSKNERRIYTVLSHSADVQTIFEHWNAKGIIKHREINKELEKALTKAFSVYSVEQIKICIDRYATVLNDDTYFFHYKWSLKDFLNRKEGISSFTDEGSKWNSYQSFIGKAVGRETYVADYSNDLKGVI